MRRNYYLFLFSVLLLWCCQNDKNVDGPITEVQPWENLFNGENIDNWERLGQFQMDIQNNVLELTASESDNNNWLLTKESFKNFKLELEFLMTDSTANSGVIFRYDPSREGSANQIAYETNIDWRTNKQNVMGTIENAARANALPSVNINEWQLLRIEAKYNYLQVYFNNELIVETHNERATEGRLGLQVPITQGDKIAFRNINVQKLPDNGLAEPILEHTYRTSSQPLINLFPKKNLDDWEIVGEGTWQFEDSILHGFSGAETTLLISNNVYKNFYLKCNFKIKKEDNSGIFIRKHPDSTNVSLNDAIECNIYDHNGFEHAFSTGSIVTHARAFSNLIDYEDWNEMEIFAQEDQIVLTINGQKSAEAYLPRKYNKAGNICLQAGTRVFSDNGPSHIYFKDLMIREMD